MESDAITYRRHSLPWCQFNWIWNGEADSFSCSNRIVKFTIVGQVRSSWNWNFFNFFDFLGYRSCHCQCSSLCHVSLHISGISFRIICGMPGVCSVVVCFLNLNPPNLADSERISFPLASFWVCKPFFFFIFEFMSWLLLWLGQYMYYHHPLASGEVHIMEDNQWASCPSKKSNFSASGNKEKRGAY